jgi:hypothetical protein
METTVLENENHWEVFGFNDEQSFVEDYIKADDYAGNCIDGLLDEIKERMTNAIMDIDEIILRHQNNFKDEYGQYLHPTMTFVNDNIDTLFMLSYDEDNFNNFIDEITYPINESIFKNFSKKE